MRHSVWPIATVLALFVTASGLAQTDRPYESANWWENERPVSGKPVVLPDSFFVAGSSGGVERPHRPIYTYRGLILIAADGRARTRLDLVAPRLDYRRAMDVRHRERERSFRRDRHSRR